MRKPLGDNGAGVTIRTPLGRNGLGYEPLKKPLGAHGKDIERWVSENREVIIAAVVTVVAIAVIQPELAAIAWTDIAVTATADGAAVGLSLAERSANRAESPQPSVGGGSGGAPLIAPEPQRAPGGRPVEGADVPRTGKRDVVTVNLNTIGVGHAWLTSESKTLKLSFGPDENAKIAMFTADSTTDWRKTNAQESISFYASDAQVAAMKREVEEIGREKGYNVLTRNCATEVLRVLDAGGIRFPRSPESTGSPAVLAEDIRNFKAANKSDGKAFPPPTGYDWQR